MRASREAAAPVDERHAIEDDLLSDDTPSPADDVDPSTGEPPTDEHAALSALVDDVAADFTTFTRTGDVPVTRLPGEGDDEDRLLTPEEIDQLAFGRIEVRKRDDTSTGGTRTDAGAPDRRGASAEADDEGAGLALLAAGEATRSRGGKPSRPEREVRARTWREERSPWWRWGFPATMFVLVLLVPALVWVGYRTVLESSDSNAVVDEAAESEPGWQALVEPTDTMAVGFVDADGELAAVSVLSLSGASAGGIVTIHPNTIGSVPGTEDFTVPAEAYAEGGSQGMADMVAAMLNTGMGGNATLAPDRLAALLESVGAVTFDNGDPVRVGDKSFDRGELTLEPADAADYLHTRNEVSDDLNRMDRYEWFWEAWLAAIAAQGEGAVPGETDSGLGSFLTQLAASQVEITTLPVEPAPVPGGTDVDKVYVPLEPQTSQLMVTVIPFPVGAPPGARVRIQLLDGTGNLNHGLPASPLLVFAGGEITSIGNATSYDNAVTKVIYYDEVMEAPAMAMRDALGVGEVEQSEAQGAAADLTIILGADWEALPIADQQIPLTQGTALVIGTSTSIVAGTGD